jgi:acetoacetyl-CoA synthetase
MTASSMAGAPAVGSGSPLWTPAPERVAGANLTRFIARYRPGADYSALWRWSVEHPQEFWAAVWEFCGVIATPRPGGTPWTSVLEGGERMAPPDPALGPRWFAGAELNFAENLLRGDDGHRALVCWNESGRQRELTYAELRHEVARWQRALRASGVVPGDRVAGYLPNLPEAVVAMLATTSLGAIWSGASPDFGAQAILNAIGQIGPRVLFAADSYRFGGEEVRVLDRVAQIAAGLPATERIVLVPGTGGSSAQARPDHGVPRAEWLDDWLERGAVAGQPAGGAPQYVRLPFDAPVYILFSSGTVGRPKAIVHGAGGTLLQHRKEHVLHTDLTRDDRVFYHTTCAWMMWHWLVSSLASGATVVLYDGSPLPAEKDLLWRMAAAERVTVFGTSARYLALCEKADLAPGRDHDLSALRTILSTGSPLAPHSFDYVYGRVRADVHLASISGGTDLISCFVLGDPTAPVWRGEIQCRGLGMSVDVFGPDGRSQAAGAGELVCTRPFPSMPVRFWDDPGGARYRAAYFERFPGAWRQGDWAERTVHDGLVIQGRSDATLNPGGVRIGTAEIYRPLGGIPEVLESIAIAQDWEDDVRIVLFVRLREGLVLDEALRRRIRHEIRTQASPHHVPRRILQVADLPRTMNGKLSETAVRAAVLGESVTNEGALANPQALGLFRNRPELAT